MKKITLSKVENGLAPRFKAKNQRKPNIHGFGGALEN